MAGNSVLSWNDALDRLTTAAGVIVNLGPVDSGKTTWMQELARKMTHPHPVIVSADLGQVTFGVPGLLAAGTWTADLSGFQDMTPEFMYFVGATHPTGYLLQTVHGITRLVNRARATGAPVLVDTDGLVHDRIGREYKRLLLSHLAPGTVVVFGSDPDLDCLRAWCQNQQDLQVMCLMPPETVRKKSPFERWQRRQAQFQRWFTNAPQRTLSLAETLILSDVTGLGTVLCGTDLAYIQGLMDTRILHAERTRRELLLLTEAWPATGSIHRLRERFPDLRIRVQAIEQWRHRLIGDFAADGFSSGLGRIVGWHLDPPGLIVEGKFLRPPGSRWVVGTATYPERTGPG